MGAFMGGLLGSALGFILIFLFCAFGIKNDNGSDKR